MEKSNRLILAALCALLLTPALYGQSHPTEGSATYVATLEESVPLPASDVEVEYIVIIWLLTSGNYDATVSVGSLSFSGANCNPVTAASLYTVMEAVSDDAVSVATGNGYPYCNLTAFSKPVRVWVEECAIRSGTNCGTSFSPASGTGWGYRAYTVACPGTGAPPSITQGTTTGDLCVGSESTLYP